MTLAKRLLVTLTVAAIAVIALCAIASQASSSAAWRVKLLTAKLTGKIPEIPFPQMLKWMRSGSAVNLYHLAESPKVDTAIRNTFDDRESGAAGALIFGRSCSGCHGANAQGQTGPTCSQR